MTGDAAVDPSNTPLLSRAIELAQSGQYPILDEIVGELARGGYDAEDIRTLFAGPVFRNVLEWIREKHYAARQMHIIDPTT